MLSELLHQPALEVAEESGRPETGFTLAPSWRELAARGPSKHRDPKISQYNSFQSEQNKRNLGSPSGSAWPGLNT